MMNNIVLHARYKQIDVKLHFIRVMAEKEMIVIEKIYSRVNPID